MVTIRGKGAAKIKLRERVFPTLHKIFKSLAVMKSMSTTTALTVILQLPF